MKNKSIILAGLLGMAIQVTPIHANQDRIDQVFKQANRNIDAREYTKAQQDIDTLKKMEKEPAYKNFKMQIAAHVKSLEGALKFAKKHKHTGGK